MRGASGLILSFVHHHDFGAGDWAWMSLMMLLVVAVVAVIAWALIGGHGPSSVTGAAHAPVGTRSRPGESAEDTLRLRLARGEISLSEYEALLPHVAGRDPGIPGSARPE